jgi:hypothetical protein
MMAQSSEKVSDFPKYGKQMWLSGTLKPSRSDGNYYPEVIAKTPNTDSKFREVIPEIESKEGFDPTEWADFIRHKAPSNLYRCTRQFLHGSTNKADYLKSITCGKDWCADCGQLGSEAHKRRYQQVLPRFKAIQKKGLSIGYLVITIPRTLRNRFKDKDALKAFRQYWKEKLKRESYEYGAIRYHWAGEDGYRWHPHLNILFESGWIGKETLEKWREELGKWFKEYCQLPECEFWNEKTKKMERHFPKSNIYFHYLQPGKTEEEKSQSESKLFHWVKYIFRATQTQYNKITAEVIYKFRNTSIWGKPDKWPPKELTQEEILAKALSGFEIDEETGEIEKITWHKDWSENLQKFVPRRIPIGLFGPDECEKLTSGFYRRWKRVIPDNYQPVYQPKLSSRPAWLDQPKKLCSPEKPENMFCPF